MTAESNNCDHERLGTLEFCTALNGDDPLHVISFLKRFVKTIQKDKKEAFSEDCDISTMGEDVIVEASDDDDGLYSTEVQQPPTKKARVEAWKLDTKSYNVPFVGTSTYKGSCGVVEKGVWPTGFLEAYLNQSSKAIEILGSGGSAKEDLPLVPPNGLLHQILLKRKENSGKLMSTKIFELYIQAVGEIATCGIPLKKLGFDVSKSEKSNEHDNQVDNSDLTAKLEKKVEAKVVSYEQLISTIMKDHLSILLNVLNNESTNSGRHSYKVIGAVLKTLANLAMTSVGTAREIVRELDNNLKEGVLQRIVAKSFNLGSMKNNQEENSDGITLRLNVQVMLLRLASVLIECGDNFVVSFAISQGVKETKSKPGVAYLVIRRVMSIHTLQTSITMPKSSIMKAFLSNLQRFYHSVCSTLLVSNHEKEVSRRLPLNSIVSRNRIPCIMLPESTISNVYMLPYFCRSRFFTGMF